MPAVSLACALNERVAARLGLDVDRPTLRDALDRLAIDEGSAITLVEAIVECGRHIDVAWRRRSLYAAELRAIADELTFPAALVVDGPAAPRVLVLWERAGNSVSAEWVTADGGESVQLESEALGRLAADQPAALLLPVAVTPMLRDPGAGDDTDAHHPRITPVRRLMQLLAAERAHIATVYVYATLVGLLSLSLPVGVQAIIGLVSGGLLLQPVALLIAFVILGTLAAGVLQLLQLSVVERIQQRIFARLALEFSFRVPRWRLQHVLETSLPEQMNRFFEVLTIQKSLSKLLTETSIALLQVLFGLVLLTFYHPYFSLFGILLLLSLAAIFRMSAVRGLQTSLLESTYKYRAVHWLQELARNLTAFKFAGRSSLSLERMDEHVSGYIRYRNEHFRVLTYQTLAVVLFKTIITGGLLVLGSVLVINRQISLGQFVASEIVIVTVLAGVEKIIGSLSVIYDILTSVDKVGHVSDLALEARGGAALPPNEAGMSLRVRDLRFTYPGAEAPALSDISFDLRAGERIGITGGAGAGQSTLLHVLAGFYHGYEGHVAFDGLTLRDLDLPGLRDQMGQYLSSTGLFDGTVEQNVAVGRRQVGAAAVQRALMLTGCAESVQMLPNGVRTQLTNGGRRLPRTLAARLLFAQAVAGTPRLLLLDDALDLFDPAARRQLSSIVFDRRVPCSALVVTRDPVLLASCDRVLVLEDGRLRAEGSWAEVRNDPYVRDATRRDEEVLV